MQKKQKREINFLRRVAKVYRPETKKNDLIISLALNLRLIAAEDAEERRVIGKATVKGRRSTVQALSANTEANRGHLIRFCVN
jgi:Tfp pilus assembly ATPase PilU